MRETAGKLKFFFSSCNEQIPWDKVQIPDTNGINSSFIGETRCQKLMNDARHS